MSNHFSRLLARARAGGAGGLRPRLPSRFEPVGTPAPVTPPDGVEAGVFPNPEVRHVPGPMLTGDAPADAGRSDPPLVAAAGPEPARASQAVSAPLTVDVAAQVASRPPAEQAGPATRPTDGTTGEVQPGAPADIERVEAPRSDVHGPLTEPQGVAVVAAAVPPAPAAAADRATTAAGPAPGRVARAVAPPPFAPASVTRSDAARAAERAPGLETPEATSVARTVVRVSIGRIEVRVAGGAAARGPAAAGREGASLDEYLRQRRAGER